MNLYSGSSTFSWDSIIEWTYEICSLSEKATEDKTENGHQLN